MEHDLAKKMRTTTDLFLHAWDGDWTAKTNEISVSYRAPQCQHIMVPDSLGIPTRSNEEWSKYFKNIEGRITEAKMRIHDYVANVEERTVAVYSTLTATTLVGPFKNEYVWFLHFDETGEKITRIKEFLDSQATANLRGQLAAAGQE
nr:austinol synthesis protein h [Quercus suber]